MTRPKPSSSIGPLLFLWVALLCTQAAVVNLSAQSMPPRFVHLSPEQGLSHDSVYEILESRDGFLWIATEDGLNRFDGYSFLTFRHDPDDPTSLAENDINSLEEDAEGHLWIGTWGAGLERFDPRTETFQHFRHDLEDPHSLQGFRVQTLLAASDGLIWAGTYRFGLNRYDPRTGRFEHFQHDPENPRSLPNDHVWSVNESPSGEIWVGTNRGLARFDPTDGGFDTYFHAPDDEQSLSHDRVRALYFDRSGNLWICTERGLDSRTPDGRFSRRLTDEGSPDGQDLRTYKDVAQGPDGNLWIATRNRGLLRLDPDSAKSGNGELGLVEIFQHDPRDPKGLSNNDVRDLLIDSADNLWIGTRGGGLNRIDLKPPKFEIYRSRNEGSLLSHERVWAITEDPDGSVWVGTSRGLDRLRRAGSDRPAEVRSYGNEPMEPDSLLPGIVRALHIDRQNRLWVGTESGLSTLEPDGETFTHYRHDPGDPTSLSHNEILCLFEDSAGNLWIGTDGGGLDRRDRWSGRFTHLRHDPQNPDSLAFDRVRALLEDTDGTLWVGTDGAGLDRLDPARSSFTHYRHDPEDPQSLSNDNVISLHRDRRGRLWVGTHSGLNLFNPADGTFRVFRDNLPSAFIYGILQGQDHQLWLATNNGILQLDPDSGDVVAYGDDDGLPSQSFNEGAHHIGRQSTLYFGGIRGLSIFNPPELQRNANRPPIYFTSIRSYSKPLDLTAPPWQVRSLELQAGSVFLSIEASALDFTAPNKNQYRYRIEGLDPDWRKLEERTVTLSDLPAGSYQLQVLGSNNDSVWSEEPATLDLEVVAPLWQKPSLQALTLLATLLGLFLLHRLLLRRFLRRIHRLETDLHTRERHLRDRERLLRAVRRDSRRFAYLVSHDFRSPLVNLQGFTGELESAVDRVQKELDPQMEKLDDGRESLERALKETIPESMGFVSDSVHRLFEMTGSIQKLSQVSEQEPSLESVDLAELIPEQGERARSILNDLDPDHRVEVRLGKVPSKSKMVSDRRYLRQILRELLANAAESVDPADGKIDIRCTRSRNKVRIHIEDNGRGIEPKNLERIFDPLYQGRPQPEPGRGMGLTLAMALAHQLDGWIDCRSSLGEGTEMVLVLPQDHWQESAEPPPNEGAA